MESSWTGNWLHPVWLFKILGTWNKRQSLNTLTSRLIQVVYKKTAGLHVALHGNISAPLRVTDLVEVSKDAAGLVVSTRNKFFWLGVQFFCEWRHKRRNIWPPWPTSPGPGRQPLGGSISLKFLLETRQQSKSFDTSDDLLRFRVQKLLSKLIKIWRIS